MALISSSRFFMAEVTSCVFSPISMKPRPITTSPLPSAVTAPRRISEPIVDVGHVADANRHAVLGRDDDALDLLDVGGAAQALHEHRLRALADVAAADVAVVLLDGLARPRRTSGRT